MEHIRLSEWTRKVVTGLSEHQRDGLAALSAEWQRTNRLSGQPLSFEGTIGQTLVTRQYVGVIQAAGVSIEIFPKLDRHLLNRDSLDRGEAASVLQQLLWILSVSGYEDLIDTGEGSLTVQPDNYLDLFALLMARRLKAELVLGVPRRYERFEDELTAIRGRLMVGRQATRNFDRWDRIACAFDEFTPDTIVCRILRCACRELMTRVKHMEARRLLSDCFGMLDDVTDLQVSTALHSLGTLPPWNRTTERFRRPFHLAVRLLRSLSHQLSLGPAESFVFLLDMNEVFEAFAAAALQQRFGVPVKQQAHLGYLFPSLENRGGILQKPDYLWQDRAGGVWIADAKYKHLASAQDDALTFAKNETVPAGRLLSPDDVRQLTVYAELYCRRVATETLPTLGLVYPFVGEGAFTADSTETWNGSTLFLLPIRLTRTEDLSSVLPPIIAPSGLR